MSATTHSITRPLDIRQFMRTAPAPGFDLVAVLDLILIGLLLVLNASNLVFAPGAAVELPRTRHPEMGGTMAPVVLTIGRNEALFFQGQKLSGRDLPERLKRYAEAHGPDPVLLIKMDRSLDLDTLFRFLDTARASGFDRVQLAAEENEAASPSSEALLP